MPTFRDRFFTGYFSYMEDALNALWMKREALAENIANINNPNYHPVHVEFKDQLEQIYHNFWRKYGGKEDKGLSMAPIQFDFDPEFHAENEASGHLEPVVVRDPYNRVDLNHEMAELYKTQMLYNVIGDNGRPSYGRDVLDQMLK